MTVAKISEITSSSKKSFEDAIEQGIKRFAKTVNKVQGAWVAEQKITVSGNAIDEYRVTLRVTFILND